MSCHRKSRCTSMQNTSVVALTAVPTPVAMVVAGDSHSKTREIEIEAKVSPQPSVAGQEAVFSFRVDGTAVGDVVQVTMAQVPALTNSVRTETLLRAVLPVGPGPHSIELLASSPDVGVDLLPGGAKLSVKAD